MDIDKLVGYFKDSSDQESEEDHLYPSCHTLERIDKRYKVDSLIGKGAVKSVFRAYDERGQRWVAYARLTKVSDEYKELFIQEAWLTGRLNHPNIIKVHDVGLEEGGRPYFTMDLRTGQTMTSLREADAPLDQLITCYRSVLRAIEYAHGEGVLHLDLKPDNIQCEVGGQVIVCDWGLGRHTEFLLHNGETDPEMEHLEQVKTLHGAIKGSPGFMAPEQAVPKSRPSGQTGGLKDQRTDIFSLGAMLYYLLTGRPPFTGEVNDIIEATRKGNYDKYVARSDSRASLQAISYRAMSLDPAARYQSVADLRADVERYVQGRIPIAEHASPYKHLRFFLARNQRGVTVGLALLSLLLICGALVRAYLDSRTAFQHQAQQAAALQENFSDIEEDYQYYRLSTEGVKSRSDYLATRIGRQLLRQVYLQDVGRERNKKENRDIVNAFMASHNLQKTIFALHEKQPGDQEILTWATSCFDTLNFRDINLLTYPVGDDFPELYLEYARQYPSFGIHRVDRPSLPELERFFRQAARDQRLTAQRLEGIFRFQWAAYRPRLDGSYDGLVVSLLKRINLKDASFRATFDRQQSTVQIVTSAEAPIFHSIMSSTYASPLSYLSAQTLVIQAPNASFDLALLDTCLASTVDLSGVNTLYTSAPFASSHLETLILPSAYQERIGEVFTPPSAPSMEPTFQVQTQ